MKKYKCKECGNIEDVSFWKELNSPHLFGRKVWVLCLKCRKRVWHTVVKEDSPKKED